MHHLSAKWHLSRHARVPHPIFLIDGVSLDLWLDQHIEGLACADLFPAQALAHAGFQALAWERLVPDEVGSSTIVPLLVSSDDVGFQGAVVVVEQEVTEQAIIWRRWGYSITGGMQVGASVRWLTSCEPLRWSLPDFDDALVRFMGLLKMGGDGQRAEPGLQVRLTDQRVASWAEIQI